MNDLGSLLGSCIIFLFVIGPNGPVPIGTAFIVGYPIPGGTDQFVPLVVTAKHVIGDHEKIYGRFSTQNAKSPGMVEYNLRELRAKGDLWEHPDEGVDIVVFRTMHFEETKYEPVPLELVASKEDFKNAAIQTTDRVVFPGLLVNFMGLTRNYPIIRNGTIAMMPEDVVPLRYQVGSRTIDTRQDVFFVDGTAIPGESGSPVFLWPGPRLQGSTFSIGGTRPLILGILHGFYPAQPREVQTIQAPHPQVFAENSDIAIVFPSWRLKEILTSQAVSSRIQQLASESKK